MNSSIGPKNILNNAMVDANKSDKARNFLTRSVNGLVGHHGNLRVENLSRKLA
jgi:hypothetical protein